MSHNMKQKLLNLLEDSLEIGWELVAVLGREHGLVIDHLLDVGHDVVHVLRSRELALLALVIQPHVEPGPGPRHLRARAQVTKLRHCPVKKVYVLEKSDSCEKKYLYLLIYGILYNVLCRACHSLASRPRGTSVMDMRSSSCTFLSRQGSWTRNDDWWG